MTNFGISTTFDEMRMPKIGSAFSGLIPKIFNPKYFILLTSKTLFEFLSNKQKIRVRVLNSGENVLEIMLSNHN